MALKQYCSVLVSLLGLSPVGARAQALPDNGPCELNEASQRQHPPQYPEASLKLRNSNFIMLRVHADKQGKVTHSETVQGSGRDDLDEAARVAALKWRVECPANAPVRHTIAILSLTGKPVLLAPPSAPRANEAHVDYSPMERDSVVEMVRYLDAVPNIERKILAPGVVQYETRPNLDARPVDVTTWHVMTEPSPYAPSVVRIRMRFGGEPRLVERIGSRCEASTDACRELQAKLDEMIRRKRESSH